MFLHISQRAKVESAITALVLLASVCGLVASVERFVEFSRSKVHLSATVKADPGSLNIVDVAIAVRGLDSGEEVEFAFHLPTHVVSVRDWTILSGQTTSKPHRSQKSHGPVVIYPSYSGVADKEGRVAFTYKASVGVQTRAEMDTAFGPRFGFVDRKHLVASLDYLLPVPRVRNQKRVEFSAGGDFNGYVQLIRGQLSPDGYYDQLFVLGTYETKLLSIQGSSITVMSTSKISKETADYVGSLFQTLTPLHSELGSSWTLIDLGSSGERRAFHTMQSHDTLALDIQPLTPERAYRIAEAMARLALGSRGQRITTLPVSETWWVDALPGYYGVKAASAAGWLSTEQVLYNAVEEDRFGGSHIGPLASVQSLSPQGRSLAATTRGYALLALLDEALQPLGSSVDRIVEDALRNRWFSDSSLYRSLSKNADATFARTWWQQNIANKRPTISNPYALSLREHEPGSHALGDRGSIFATTGLFGNLELCGCKLNQFGGAARRGSFIREHNTSNSLVLDLGNFLPRATIWKPDAIEQIEAEAQLEIIKKWILSDRHR
jgi:hypothetical protein